MGWKLVTAATSSPSRTPRRRETRRSSARWNAALRLRHGHNVRNLVAGNVRVASRTLVDAHTSVRAVVDDVRYYDARRFPGAHRFCRSCGRHKSSVGFAANRSYQSGEDSALRQTWFAQAARRLVRGL